MYGEYVQKTTTQGHKLIFNERRGNPHMTGQAAAGPQKYYHTSFQRKSCSYIHM